MEYKYVLPLLFISHFVLFLIGMETEQQRWKNFIELTASERRCNLDTKGNPIDNPPFPRVSE